MAIHLWGAAVRLSVKRRVLSVLDGMIGIVDQFCKRQGANCGTGAGGFKPGNSCGRGTSGTALFATGKTNKDGSPQMEHRLPNGDALPAHIGRIPPAWKDVTISLDPKASVYVKGKDEKGRGQAVYSPTHTETQAVKKFAKTRKLLEKHDALGALHEKNANSKDVSVSEPAKVMSVIHALGLRPGSEKDTGAEKQAYGATTLRSEHVVKMPDGSTRLKFVGKKGVSIDLPVDDPKIADLLHSQAAKAKGGKLFNVTDAELRNYSQKHGGYNPKDYRTAKGTKTAREEVAKMEVPKTEKEKKKAMKTVGTVVSSKLGNTPTIALQSYIDPAVFKHWHLPG